MQFYIPAGPPSSGPDGSVVCQVGWTHGCCPGPWSYPQLLEVRLSHSGPALLHPLWDLHAHCRRCSLPCSHHTFSLHVLSPDQQLVSCHLFGRQLSSSHLVQQLCLLYFPYFQGSALFVHWVHILLAFCPRMGQLQSDRLAWRHRHLGILLLLWHCGHSHCPLCPLCH